MMPTITITQLATGPTAPKAASAERQLWWVAMPPATHYFSPCEQCGYTDDGPREWCA